MAERTQKHAQHKVSAHAADIKFQKPQEIGSPVSLAENAAESKLRKQRGYANRLLRRPEVEARTGLSRSTIYEWMKRGEFPQPVKLGERLVAWKESDIADWLDSRETRVAEIINGPK